MEIQKQKTNQGKDPANSGSSWVGAKKRDSERPHEPRLECGREKHIRMEIQKQNRNQEWPSELGLELGQF